MNFALVLFVFSALYPLRAGWSILQANLSSYRQWSSAWDTRQAQVFAAKAKGDKDLVVFQLPALEYIKEIDTRPRFWVNRCAAAFYGVNSIRAVPYDP